MERFTLAIRFTFCILLATLVGAAASAQTIDGLSTTWVGELVPGEMGKLAVSWDGEPGVELDVWVDFDGDGAFGQGELLVVGRLLERGIEALDVQVPGWVEPGAGAQMKLRLRGVGERVVSLPGSVDTVPKS